MTIGRRTIAIREPQRFLLLSIVIGISAGLLVVCFHIAIESAAWLTFERGPLARFLSPAAGALLGILLVTYVFRHARGSGVTDTKAAVYISDGYVPPSAIAGKFLACSVSIGFGNPLGPEDPSLHMGAGVASWLGRLFRLNRDRMRLIAPVGAAAGIAAAFNTPITGVLFVIEEIVAGWNAGVLGSIMLASVSATVVVRWFLGDQPLFLVPEFRLTHPSELAVHAFVGLVGGLLAVGFVKLAAKLRRQLGRLKGRARLAAPVGAGILVGVAGIWLPQVLGAGYGTIDGALHHRFPWNVLLVLAVTKAALTLICFSARTPGGMFAPTLFAGAMIGGGIGGLAEIYWPFPTSPSSAYVLVGMGTFFAGVFRAPMTSIFMIFEVSASYVIILPVMIANTIAYLISRQMQPTPFFTQLAADEGLELPSTEQQREAPRLLVENAMSPAGQETRIPDGAHVHPDLPLEAALPLLASQAVVPVVTRVRPYRLVGTLTLEDVHRAYGIKGAARDAE
ncbi:MAG TPA: chloride channel protein [Bryobacteraceae bacterium]|nr:chloride channel protein [Bryobacteraceae bacterium]